ncbi:MAG: hypothetical protein V1725_01575 [archaeon]
MALRDLQKTYEKRRTDLIDLLENGNLDPAKQHQVYGAILEIETFLKTIKHHIEQEDEFQFKLRK